MFNQNFDKYGIRAFGFIMIVVMVLCCRQYFIRKKVETEGRFVKCEVVKSEGFKGGILTTVKYFFKGKEYISSARTPNAKERIGKTLFVKLWPADPSAIILFENNAVPDCLLTKEAPDDGWTKIPICE